MEEVKKNILSIDEIKEEILNAKLSSDMVKIENYDVIKKLFEDNCDIIVKACQDGEDINFIRFAESFLSENEPENYSKINILNQLFNEVVESKTQSQQEPLDAPAEGAEKKEEKSEREGSTSVEESTLPEQSESLNAEVPTGQEKQDAEVVEQQQSIKDRLNKINSDAENLIRLRNADEIEGFMSEEKFNDERYVQLINTQQSYISALKKEVEILGCEKVVLLEQKERLEKKVSGYEEMCEKKNEEIKINNAKVRELNTRNSAILKLTQESVAEQIYSDSNFRNVLMAKYKKVGYKLKTLAADEQEVENKTQSELYDSTYNLYKDRQQNDLSEVMALKTRLLALAGATETVKKEEAEEDVSRSVLD